MKNKILIGFLTLLSPFFVLGASNYINGNNALDFYWDDVTGFYGIGISNPGSKLDISGNLTVSGLASCNTIDTDGAGLLSCGTDAGGGLVLATSTTASATDSANKSVTAWCPQGYRAVGGGGQVTSGASTDLHAEMSYPTATTSGWIFSANEGDAVSGNWQITAHVICAQI